MAIEAETDPALHPVRTRSEVASYLGYLLRRIWMLGGQASEACAHADDESGHSARLRLKELSVLQLLGADGPASQQDLADRLGINRSIMVKVIDGLERDGFVLRTRDPNDRRRYALQMTDAGSTRAAALRAWSHAIETALLAPLGAPQRRRVVALLATLAAAHGPAQPVPLNGSLLWLVMAVHHALETVGDAVLTPFGLTIRSFVALAILDDEPCAQGRLGALLSIGPTATVELVDQLEHLGVLRRVRSAADRRQYRIELTAAGSALHRQARPVVEAASEAFSAPLGPAGREELLSLLTTLARITADA